jgi:hypothetical protein
MVRNKCNKPLDIGLDPERFDFSKVVFHESYRQERG